MEEYSNAVFYKSEGARQASKSYEKPPASRANPAPRDCKPLKIV
jgi:hypothetical protein